MIEIFYNSINPFDERVPFVSSEVVFEDNNGYISRVDRYTLSGTRERPSCNPNFAEYKTDIDYLLSVFHLNFKKFEMKENGRTFFLCDQAQVKSITFPETSFQSFYRYEIVIDCIQSYENLGIVNPQETYETSQDDSPVTTIRHNVSCRGVGPNAVNNAKSFVDSRRAKIIGMSFAGDDTDDSKFVKISRNYNVNRLTGEVSLTTTYLYNEENVTDNYSVITYTCEISNSIEDSTITISGQIQGNSIDGESELTKTKSKFDEIDWQALAQLEWENWGGQTSLSEAVEFSVNEDPFTAQVSFSLSWSTNVQEGPYIQESWTVSRDYTGEPTCFTYRGTVRDDSGCVGQRFAAVEALFAATNFQGRVANLWAKYGTGESLSYVARSQSVSSNPFVGTKTFEITYCHDPGSNCGCAENMTYTMSFVEPIQQYSSQPILKGAGRYSTQNLGIKNRRKFSIQGTARRAKCCTVEQTKSNIKTRLNFLMNLYFAQNDRILEEAEIDNSDTGDNLSFNYTWSAAA